MKYIVTDPAGAEYVASGIVELRHIVEQLQTRFGSAELQIKATSTTTTSAREKAA